MSPNPGAPNGPTAWPSHPPLGTKYVRDTIAELRTRIARLEVNRTPAGIQLHQLTNAGPMSQADQGHAAVYDQNTGQFSPTPVLAVLTFHMQGALSLAASPPTWARYPCYVIGWSANLGTVGDSNVQFDINLAGPFLGTTVSCSMTGAGAGHNAVDPPIGLQAYVDKVSITTKAIGNGNADLIVQVELGSVVSGQASPLPAPAG